MSNYELLQEALSRTLLLARDGDLIGPLTPADDEIIEALRRTRVAVVADEANLRSPAGQHALVALFSQVARLSVSLHLAMPEVPLLGLQPPVRGEHLRAGLIDLSYDLLPDWSVTVGQPHDAVDPFDVAFLLGDSPWNGQADLAVRLTGDEWSGATVPASKRVPSWTGSFPIGALTAAGIAAPEAFKAALRRLMRSAGATPTEFLEPVEVAQVQVAPSSTPTGPYALGRVDAVSGGAIVNAAMFVLLRVPRISGDVRVIEPESHDLSNLNRYALLRRSQAGASKIDVLQEWQAPEVQISGEAVAFIRETRERIVHLAPRVLVGTDDIPARWDVQREWPSWLGVGATSHFLTVTSSHTPKQPCAGCLHSYDDPGVALIPTVSFVSYWAGLLLAVRLLRNMVGDTLSADEQCLYCTPLRLDQGRAYWTMPVAPTARCPVHCPASQHVPARTGP